MKAIKLFTIICALFLGTQAQANIFNVQNDRSEILLDTKHFQGQNLVRIRNQVGKKLKAQGMNIQDFKLVGITLRAKSKNGKGKATLIVGNDKSTKNVKASKGPGGFGGFGGDLGDLFEDFGWLDAGGKSFNRIVWDLRGQPGLSSERWQLQLKGNIKVDFMEVHLQSAMTKVRINLGDKIYGPGPQAVSNKVLIKQSLKAAGYKPNQFKLRAVRVIGKSRQGKGTVTLKTGNQNQGTKVLGKAPQGNFNTVAAKSYNRVAFKGFSAANGAWQLQFKGANRVKAAVLILEDK